MNRFSGFILKATLVLAVCGVPAGTKAEGEPQVSPPLREIPGVTAQDQFPRGCVDCHVNRPDLNMDVRISIIIRRWQDKVDPAFLAKVKPFVPESSPLEGKHPMFQADVADIPQVCLECHTKKSEPAPPLGRMLHGLHFAGGEKNHFISMFQGQCTHCHKLDAETGVWSLGSGRETE